MKKLNSRLILEIVIVLFWSSEYAHVPYFTPYLRSLGAGAALIGMIVAAYGFTQMLLRIPVGITTDITGAYRFVIISGLFLTTVSSLGLYLTKNIFLIFICRVLAGAASSTWIASTVVYMTYFPSADSVRASARLNALNNGGKLLAFAAGGAAAASAGYRAALFVSFATGLLGLVLSLSIDKVELRRERLSVRRVAAAMTSRGVLVPSLLMAAQQMILHATVFSFTSDIARQAGASSVMLSVLSAVFTAVQILSASLISSPFFRRLPRNRALAAGYGLLSAYVLILGYSGTVSVLLLGQAAAAVGSAVLASVLLSECLRGVPDGEKSTVVGTFQAVYGLGMTAGPVLMGSLMEHSGIRFGCTAFSAVGIALTAAVLLLWRRDAG
jgi:MFS family permease